MKTKNTIKVFFIFCLIATIFFGCANSSGTLYNGESVIDLGRIKAGDTISVYVHPLNKGYCEVQIEAWGNSTKQIPPIPYGLWTITAPGSKTILLGSTWGELVPVGLSTTIKARAIQGDFPAKVDISKFSIQ